MRLRLASISFLLGSVGTGLVWLSVGPTLLRLLEPSAGLAQTQSVRAALPFYMAFGLLSLSAFAYLVLDFTVARPLRIAEQSIERLGSLDPGLGGFAPSSGGTLVARLEAALARSAEALLRERSVTHEQLDQLRRANLELGEAQTKLAASEQLATVGTLAAGVAHEVGNPLAGILGYLSILKSRTKENPEQVDILERVEAEVGRIDQIVRSLLDLGRPPQGTPTPVALLPLIRSAAALSTASAEMGAVKVELSPGDDVVVQAQVGPLSQIVLNLLLNAAQAMGQSGTIRVRVGKEGAWGVVEIRDEGPGLSPEVRARLFEPFFTQRVSGKGTGLGLAVSQHLVRSMNGELWGANHPEGGAVFTVKLPLPG